VPHGLILRTYGRAQDSPTAQAREARNAFFCCRGRPGLEDQFFFYKALSLFKKLFFTRNRIPLGHILRGPKVLKSTQKRKKCLRKNTYSKSKKA
jgi:hypothetical protein